MGLALAAVLVIGLLPSVGCGGVHAVTRRGPTGPRLSPTDNFFHPELELDPETFTAEGRRDLDGDGTDECWTARWNRGGGYGGMTLTVTRGCAGAPAVLSSFGPVPPMLLATRIPLQLGVFPGLVQRSAELLLGTLHHRTLALDGQSDLPAISPSFRWLVERITRPAFSDSLPIRDLRGYSDLWIPGPPVLPDSQFALVSDPADAPLARAVMDEGAPLVPEGDPRPYALLMYRASHHGPLTEIGRCQRWTLYSSGHGLVAYDPETDSHSWVYIETRLEQPRYATLQKAVCSTGVVVIQTAGPRHHELIVAAPDLGRYATIDLLRGEPWSVDLEQHLLIAGGGRFELLDLRRRLGTPDP